MLPGRRVCRGTSLQFLLQLGFLACHSGIRGQMLLPMERRPLGEELSAASPAPGREQEQVHVCNGRNAVSQIPMLTSHQGL